MLRTAEHEMLQRGEAPDGYLQEIQQKILAASQLFLGLPR